MHFIKVFKYIYQIPFFADLVFIILWVFKYFTTLHTGHATLRFLEQSTPAFIPPNLCLQNSTILIRSITRYGTTSSNKCISRSCTALTNWRSVCWTFGTTSWTRESLTMQLMSGISVFQCMCGQKADILCKCCKLPNRVMRYFIFSSNRWFVICREF